LKAIKEKWDFYLEKQARVKANNGVDPDAPEEPVEHLANGVKDTKVQETVFELDDTLAFPGGIFTIFFKLDYILASFYSWHRWPT
jgi:hypothetical protein